jgi:hypothetical protein
LGWGSAQAVSRVTAPAVAHAPLRPGRHARSNPRGERREAASEERQQRGAHVVDHVFQAVAHRARQHVDLARAAVGPVQPHALDDARQEAVGVADAAAWGARQNREGAAV